MTTGRGRAVRNERKTGPLAGMRVLELAQIMAGPTAGDGSEPCSGEESRRSNG
jgi:hypothetical protein